MPETSLVYTVISLAHFFSDNFPNINWYPYWYLGNPYRFLIGPIIPVLLALLNIASISFLKGYFIIIAFSVFLGGWGLFLLLSEFGIKKKYASISSIIYIVFPAAYLVLGYQNGLKHIALSFIPFILLISKRYLEKDSFPKAIVISLLISMALLINVSTFIAIIISLLSLFYVSDSQNASKKFLKILIFVLLAISFSTLWYTPSYWWILLTNPSIGGLSFFKLAINIVVGIFQLLPLALAIIVTRWRKVRYSQVQNFAILFLTSFLALSILRFIMDPDFIMDWTGFVPELQMGIAILVGVFSDRLIRQRFFLSIGIGVIIVLDCYIVVSSLNHLIAQSSSSEDNIYKEEIAKMIAQNVSVKERIFISGSPVFWINDKKYIFQIRGANDTASSNSWWAHGAYQIREGLNPALAYYWLRIFGASYILVHGEGSKEYFHDFKNLYKYSESKFFERKKIQNGDSLYKVKDSSIARIAESSLLQIDAPENGADAKALNSYVKNLKRIANYNFNKPNEITVKTNISKNEIISLAITHDSRWKIIKGKGRVVSDSFSNMVIIPDQEGQQEFVISYRRSTIDWLIPSLFILALIVIFNQVDLIYIYIKKIAIKFSIGSSEEEKDY